MNVPWMRAWVGLCTVVVLAGCAPGANTTSQSPDRRQTQEAPSRPKTITIGIQHGFPDFSPFTASSTGGSAANIPPMVNDGLLHR